MESRRRTTWRSVLKPAYIYIYIWHIYIYIYLTRYLSPVSVPWMKYGPIIMARRRGVNRLMSHRVLTDLCLTLYIPVLGVVNVRRPRGVVLKLP
jgi:hypothetical protein